MKVQRGITSKLGNTNDLWRLQVRQAGDEALENAACGQLDLGIVYWQGDRKNTVASTLNGLTADSVWSAPAPLADLRLRAPQAASAVKARTPSARRARNVGTHSRMRLLAVAASTAVLTACANTSGLPWRVEPIARSTDSPSSANNSKAYESLARMYEGEGRWDQAVQAWQRAVAMDPTQSDLRTALGVALVRTQRLNEAIASFRQAAALAPNNAAVLNNLGYALNMAGQDDEARLMLRSALAIDPSHARAQRNLETVERLIAARDAKQAPSTAAKREDAVPPLPSKPEAAVQVQAARSAPSKVATAPDTPVQPSRVTPAMDVVSVATVAALTVNEQRLDLTPLAVSEPLAAMPATAMSLSAPVNTLAPQATLLATFEATKPTANSVEPLRISVVNGVGIDGAAGKLRKILKAQSLDVTRLQNLAPYNVARTVVQYRKGYRAAAEKVAGHLPVAAELVEVNALGAQLDVRVLLGHDRRAALSACVSRNACQPAGAVRVGQVDTAVARESGLMTP